MTGELYSPLVERAMRTAAEYHRHHCRKGSEIPYMTHLASVALILAKAGFDGDDVIAAALLHDCVEDTDLTIEELAAQYPAKVVEHVAALTERKRDEAGAKRSWQDRKDEHLVQVAQASLEARAIVLADKLHNLSTMLDDLESGNELWNRFNAPREKILSYHRAMIESAAQEDARLKPIADACRAQLERLEATAR